MGQSFGDAHQDGIRSLADLRLRLILNRVRNINRIEVWPTESRGLNPCSPTKLIRRDWHGRNSEIFQLNRIVQTARGAGASISEGFNDALTLIPQNSVADFRRRAFRKRRLRISNHFPDAELFFQQFLDPIQKMRAARFADIQKPNRRIFKCS